MEPSASLLIFEDCKKECFLSKIFSASIPFLVDFKLSLFKPSYLPTSSTDAYKVDSVSKINIQQQDNSSKSTLQKTLSFIQHHLQNYTFIVSDLLTLSNINHILIEWDQNPNFFLKGQILRKTIWKERKVNFINFEEYFQEHLMILKQRFFSLQVNDFFFLIK
jgi:hypothetical protein